MDPGALLTFGTIYLSLSLYATALALRWTAAGRRSRLAWARSAWTAGFGVHLLHVAAAFVFYHDLSHDAAARATAARTAAVVGWDWGGGIYVNYVFSLVWFVDVLWWWRGLEGYETRPRAFAAAIHGFLAFIIFNATVVFGQPATQVVAAIAGFALLLLWLRTIRRAALSS